MTSTATLASAAGPERAFRIPAENLSRLRAQIADLAKKAAKLDVEAPALLEVGEELRPVTETEPWGEGVYDAEHPAPVRRYVLAVITGSAPRLNGWEFASAIEHTPAGNLVHTFKGEADEALRTIDAACDHCGTKRSRKNTYVVLHEDGRTAHVGRNCLADFTGHADPERLAGWAELLGALLDGGAEDDDYEYGGGRGEWTFAPVDVVAQANACIRAFGWNPASSPEPGSTRDDTVKAIDARKKEDEVPTTYADFADARKALAWIAEQNGSDYIWNLKTVASMDEVPFKRFGLLVSLPAAYSKAMEREIKMAARKADEAKAGENSTPQGEVKERITRTVVVTRVIEIPGDWGTTHLHKMLDTDGNAYCWFASSEQDVSQGESVTITGTVKSHGEYQGIAETVLTRCKLTNDRIAADAKAWKVRDEQHDEMFALAQDHRDVEAALSREQVAKRQANRDAHRAAVETGDIETAARLDAEDAAGIEAFRAEYATRQAARRAEQDALKAKHDANPAARTAAMEEEYQRQQADLAEQEATLRTDQAEADLERVAGLVEQMRGIEGISPDTIDACEKDWKAKIAAGIPLDPAARKTDQEVTA